MKRTVHYNRDCIYTAGNWQITKDKHFESLYALYCMYCIIELFFKKPVTKELLLHHLEQVLNVSMTHYL